jgi:hypothetical protein
MPTVVFELVRKTRTYTICPQHQMPRDLKELNVTGDTEGIEELLKGYEVVTPADIDQFAQVFAAVEMAEKKEAIRIAKDQKMPDDPMPASAAAPSQDLLAYPEPEDGDSLMERLIKNNPLPLVTEKRSQEIPFLVTEDEENTIKRYKKRIRDLTPRESAIFVHGYRARGDYENKHMQALLSSLNQTAQVMASQGRNVRHLTNTLHEGVKDTRKRPGDQQDKPVAAKAPKTLMDYQRKAVNALLDLDQSNYEKAYSVYGLSVTQMYDAFKELIIALDKGDFSFIEPPNKWPDVMYGRLEKKIEELKKDAASSGTK